MTIDIKNVETIATNIMKSIDEADSGRGKYLKSLLTETQATLKKGQPKAEQILALKAIHDVFYEAVLRIAEAFVPKGTKDRSIALHARCTFARTAVSALRRYVVAGNDLAAVNAKTVTKVWLKERSAPSVPKKRSARLLRGLAERRSKALVSVLMDLASTEPEAAAEELRTLIGQLQGQLDQMEKPPPQVPVLEKRRAGRIRPSDTQVLTARSMPA